VSLHPFLFEFIRGLNSSAAGRFRERLADAWRFHGEKKIRRIQS